ncbi:MAG TPA: hypothetical protein P5341_09000 [Hyphomonas sp.]|nr:hypothetical protein [Hyphomonas sp.]
MGLHEYSVIGHRRAQIAMYQAFLAGALAGILATVTGLLLDMFVAVGWAEPHQWLLWPVTGGVVFGVIFALFTNFVWKAKYIRNLVGVPNLAGTWTVKGVTFDQDEKPQFNWEGILVITQNYEKLTVRLDTAQSGSSSATAAVIPEGDTGYRLIYSYKNDPKPGNPELFSHFGHCEMIFASDLQSAEGKYFNGLGRGTHGTMELERKI